MVLHVERKLYNDVNRIVTEFSKEGADVSEPRCLARVYFIEMDWLP